MRTVALLGFATLTSVFTVGEPAAKQAPILASIAQVLQQTNAQAALHHPFRLRAQVTLYQPEIYRYFLQNGKAGIYFNPRTDNVQWRVGDLVEVEGVTAVGLFAPILEVRRARVLGRGPPPPATASGRSKRVDTGSR